jgi:hypothetical protein
MDIAVVFSITGICLFVFIVFVEIAIMRDEIEELKEKIAQNEITNFFNKKN